MIGSHRDFHAFRLPRNREELCVRDFCLQQCHYTNTRPEYKYICGYGVDIC